MWWHEKSWPEIESLDKRLPVVVPLGSIEQHGYHLPLFVDSDQVTAVARRAQDLLADEAIFLPTFQLGCSEHHRDFPGTISVPPSVYAQNIKAIARSILSAGFTRIFFLNGHGGNETPAAHALTELVGEDDKAEAAWLIFASWWMVARDALKSNQCGTTTPSITHACEYETSLMLALRPDLVKLAKASSAAAVLNQPNFHSEYGGNVRVFRRFHRLTTSGSMGDPSAATTAKGKQILTTAATQLATFIRELAQWPELPIIRARPSPA